MKQEDEDTFFAAFIGLIFLICILAVGTFVVGSEADYQSRLEERKITLYPAWMAAHPDSSLNFEQWNTLYVKNLLPK